MKKRSIIIAVILFALLIAGVVTAYSVFREKPEETHGTETAVIENGQGETEIVTIGAKEVTITFTDDKGVSTTSVISTDALYLADAMTQAGLIYEAEATYVNTINGVTADYDKDQSYWAFYVNEEYCNYGIFEQPVSDGDVFVIAYTIYEG